MAQMNRNVNLEEIDSDALFGIDALKNQSIFQKIIFWGSVISGVMLNVLLPIFFETPRMVCIVAFLSLLLVGVAFGCNYTEDMTYGKYLYYFFFKPSTPLFFSSTEDVEKIKEAAKKTKAEEEMLLRQKQQADPVEQKKLLMKVIIFVVVLTVAIASAVVFGNISKKNHVHHRAEEILEETYE